MPKLKTHKGAAKRFRLTKNGKVMRMRAGNTHLRRNKRSNAKRNMRHAIPSTVKAHVKLVKQVAGQATSE
jgi:large subunit ribosomal protein L35